MNDVLVAVSRDKFKIAFVTMQLILQFTFVYSKFQRHKSFLNFIILIISSLVSKANR